MNHRKKRLFVFFSSLLSENDLWFQCVCATLFYSFFSFFLTCLLWILIAHLLQSLLQMLAGLAWNDYQSQIPLASFPVTLLHGDGTRAGTGAEAATGGWRWAAKGMDANRPKKLIPALEPRWGPTSSSSWNGRDKEGWLAMMSRQGGAQRR